ncbi:MAG: alpha/beta hydrolase [Woeseiaceae bacterium]
MKHFFLTLMFALGVSTVGAAEVYELGPDSKRQEGVPQGTVTKHQWTDSQIYPGTETEYWVYVPSQYTDEQPAAVMVFQDGEAYVHDKGDMRAPIVMDNLIHQSRMPVTIAVFINPSKKEQPGDQRENQYVPISDSYASFVLDEILPQVEKNYTLVDEANGRAIAGMSDGGLAAFTVAWHRPDAFSKVVSHIGSYTRLRGGSEYPYLIRRTRGNPKPIRVFLQDGLNDLNLFEGNWTLANMAMASALQFGRYDYRLEMGDQGHTLTHGGAILPETLHWIWRDYPGVVTDPVDLSLVTGDWDVVTNYHGYVFNSLLSISLQDGQLVGALRNEEDGELDVQSVSFDGDRLFYSYTTPESQAGWSGKKDGVSSDTMEGWLRLEGEALEGVLSAGTASEYDFAVTAKRVAVE